MNREKIRRYVIAHSTDYLEPDKSGKGWICPICGSGSGKNGTGITTKDGVHFTCWHGCYTNSDIIDIVGKKYGLTNYVQKLQKATEILGKSVKSFAECNGEEKKTERKTQENLETDFTEFFLEANKNINKTEYHRGITIETLNRFKIGYVENWRHPKAPNTPASPRLIIPTSQYSYIARDTRLNLTETQKKYSKLKVGHMHIFNNQILQKADKPIFVVEGELDALSIIDVGGEAIGLGSIVMRNAFLKMLENQKPTRPLLLAMDNDPEGQAANKALSQGLEKLKIHYHIVDIAASHKDANEALIKDRKNFERIIKQMEKMA